MPARVADSVTAMPTLLSLQTDSSSIFKKSSFKSQGLLGPPCVTLKSEDFSGPEKNLEVTPRLSHQNLAGVVGGQLERESSDGSWPISPNETL